MTSEFFFEGRYGSARLFAPRVDDSGEFVASAPISTAAGSINAFGNHVPVHSRSGIGRQYRPEEGLSKRSYRVLELVRHFSDESGRGLTDPRLDFALEIDNPIDAVY
ncbi:MAG: hypothetical protein OXJ37_01695 [Bryobacterales bacterium]|nr:hypothetical protein [Bryobacterales bacterium]